jgi:hypothetical protein
MKVQIHTDSHVDGHEAFVRHVTRVVESTLSRFGERVTRVEVHLSDENGPKSGLDDKRCTMEVRVAGLRPTAVSHRATTVHDAVGGAVHKLQSAVESAIGRRAAHSGAPRRERASVPASKL